MNVIKNPFYKFILNPSKNIFESFKSLIMVSGVLKILMINVKLKRSYCFDHLNTRSY